LNDEHPVLDIIESLEAGRIRVRLHGDLDLATAPALSETLSRLRLGRQAVVLDLDQLEFIDMSGLRVVVTAAREAVRAQVAFVVTRGSSQVRRLVDLAGFADQLPHWEGA
jgi:anti-anti-sigma factor